MAKIGILLGVSLSVMISSFLIVVFSATGAIRRSVVTGAVVGTTGVMSYAVISFVLSLVAVFFLLMILKKPYGNLVEYYS